MLKSQPTYSSETVMSQTNESSSTIELIFHVVGILSALTLLLGTVTVHVVLLLKLVRKEKLKHQQKHGEHYLAIIAICKL